MDVNYKGEVLRRIKTFCTGAGAQCWSSCYGIHLVIKGLS